MDGTIGAMADSVMVGTIRGDGIDGIIGATVDSVMADLDLDMQVMDMDGTIHITTMDTGTVMETDITTVTIGTIIKILPLIIPEEVTTYDLQVILQH